MLYMYSWLQKGCTFFLWVLEHSLLSEWLVLIHESINKNQLLDEQAAIRNPSKKSVATFLWSVVHTSIGEICKRNKATVQIFAWRIMYSAVSESTNQNLSLSLHEKEEFWLVDSLMHYALCVVQKSVLRPINLRNRKRRNRQNESTINHQRFAVPHISSSISHGMERTLRMWSHDAELTKHLWLVVASFSQFRSIKIFLCPMERNFRNAQLALINHPPRSLLLDPSELSLIAHLQVPLHGI